MNGDYYSALAYLLGGAGILGLVFSYLQLREQRIEQRRNHLRETALTPAFRSALGGVLSVTELVEELGVAQKTAKEKLQIVQSMQSIWDNIETSEFNGSMFFLPKCLQIEFWDMASLLKEQMRTVVVSVEQQKTVAVDVHELGVRLDRFSMDLKKELGIE
jgi:hypothetical protein